MTHCSRNGGPGNINRLVVGSILNAEWTTRTSEAEIPSAADILHFLVAKARETD